MTQNGAGDIVQGGIVTGLASVPDTCKQASVVFDDKVPHAGVPHANSAPSIEHPQGSPERKNSKKTVLQQHVDYFDLNGDGIITPAETFLAASMLGFGLISGTIGMIVIHGMFSYVCADSWIPDPYFRIKIKNIHRGKHGSDTETYDTAGRFVPQKFEEIFTKFDTTNKKGLTYSELLNMIKANRNAMDFVGWSAAMFESTFAWLLLKDENGVVGKEDLRQCIDGTIFYKIANARYKQGLFKRKPPAMPK